MPDGHTVAIARIQADPPIPCSSRLPLIQRRLRTATAVGLASRGDHRLMITLRHWLGMLASGSGLIPRVRPGRGCEPAFPTTTPGRPRMEGERWARAFARLRRVEREQPLSGFGDGLGPDNSSLMRRELPILLYRAVYPSHLQGPLT